MGNAPRPPHIQKSAGEHPKVINQAILQDIYLQFVSDCTEILCRITAITQEKSLYRFTIRVHDPVFPDAGPLDELI